MKKNRFTQIMLILALVLIVFAVIGKKAGWFGQAFRHKVAVETPEYRDIIEIITANGKIQPEIEVELSPDVSGEIVRINVEEGDYVEKGQLLLKIKPDAYMSIRDRTLAAVNSSKARLAQAKAQYIQSELAWKRSKTLYEQNTISQSDYEQAEASYSVATAEVEAAEYSVKSAEASLAEADETLKKTNVYAPMSGTISMLMVELGERVVGTEMMSGTPIMRIADLDRMEVVVDVNENDIIHVELNDTALVEVDAYLDQDFKGVVTEIANSATTAGMSTDQVTTFSVKILLLKSSYARLIKNGKSPFRPGMSATVDIQTETKTNILTIPIQAVTTRKDTSRQALTIAEEELRTLVFVARNEFAISLDVTTGIQDNNYIEILSGLPDTEKVVIAPYSAISKKLSDSTLIEVVPEEELFEEK